MEALDSNAIQLELKYCERCGGLWLRRKGSELVLCSPCARLTAGLVRNRIVGRRGPESLRPARDAQIHTAFWSEGDNA